MRPKRPDTAFRGVYHDDEYADRPYRAWIKTGSKLIIVDHYATETHAALAADFARWICWGPPGPAGWYSEGRRRMSNPPNFGPLAKLPFDREAILRKLLAAKVLDAVKMADGLEAYDGVAEKLSGVTT